MRVSEMKKLLARSKAEPVFCAFGIAEDGKSAVLMLDKVKQPRMLLQQLQRDYPKAATPRFGTAAIDEQRDPRLVSFSINKAGSGLARRLVKTLRGTGYSKVEILLEDGSVAELAGAEDEETTEQAIAVQRSVAPAAPPGQPVETAPPARDEASLARVLSALAKRLVDVTDQTQRITLVTVARAAQFALKSGDLAGAERSIRELNAGLSNPVSKLAPRAIWLAAKEAVDRQLEALARELRSYDDPDLTEVANFRSFGLFGGRETVDLTTTLIEFESAAPERKQHAKAALAKAVQSYRAGFLENNELVKLVDGNPFEIEVALRQILGDALSQIDFALA